MSLIAIHQVIKITADISWMVCKWLAITAQKFGELSLFTVYFCFSRKKLEPYRTTAVRPFLAMNTGIIAIPWAIRIGMVSGTMATAGELCIIVKTPRRADNLAEVVPATTKNVQPLVLARACKYLVSSLILLFLVFFIFIEFNTCIVLFEVLLLPLQRIFISAM